jgi:hypothetical protein
MAPTMAIHQEGVAQYRYSTFTRTDLCLSTLPIQPQGELLRLACILGSCQCCPIASLIMDQEELLGNACPTIPPFKANTRSDGADRAVTGFNDDWPIHRRIGT